VWTWDRHVWIYVSPTDVSSCRYFVSPFISSQCIEIETSNLVRVNRSLRVQTIREKGVVRSREPLQFWWTPAIYLERLKIYWSVFTRVGCVKSQHKDDK